MDAISFILFIYFYVVLRIEPSASHMGSKHSTTEPHPCHYVAVILLMKSRKRKCMTPKLSLPPLKDAENIKNQLCHGILTQHFKM